MGRRGAGLASAAGLFAAGCACPPADTGGGAAPWPGVEVALDPPSIRWGTGEIVGIEVGRVAGYDPSRNHDPWLLVDPEFAWAAPAVEWARAERARWEDEVLVLELEDGTAARLERLDDGGEGTALRLSLDDGPAPYLRLSFALDPAAPVWGLGEVFSSVDHRGEVLPMQMELEADLESGYNEVHVPVPLAVSAEGWAVGVPTDWPAVFDVGASDPERLSVVVDTEDPLDVVLLGGGEVGEAARGLDLVAAWVRRTGLPPHPPDWALAPMLWRDENEDAAEVVSDARAVREHDLAFGVMWVDRPWQSTLDSMEPDPDRFGDWDAMVAELHDLGFRWMAWNAPYVEEADPDHDRYAAKGWFVDLPVPFNDFGDLVDLVHPDAMAAWQARVEAARGIGIEGWKLDYAEDVQLGYGTGRLETGFADGRDERVMHHRFAEYYHRAYAEPYDAAGADRFLLGRAGAWGTQAVTTCIWPGDLCNDFYEFGEDGHVGGLPVAVRAGLGLAASGFPCFASDTGGYRHGRADQETIVRWTEYSALLPVMQVGNTDQHHYWLLEGDWTEQVLEAGRRYTVLHTRLFPYFQRLVAEAAERGVPPVRLPGLVDGPVDVDDAFLVGDALYVAPVLERGATARTVSFPPGRWVHWWTGEVYEGEAEVDAPLGEGPLFVAEGGIVPMLRESVRTLAPSDGSVESWADDPGGLVVRHVPGEGRFEVVDGPVLEADGSGLDVGEPGIYSGVRVEVFAPGATRLYADGEPLSTSVEGSWISAEVPAPSRVTWD